VGTLTIIAVIVAALIVAVFVAACWAAHRRCRRQAEHWRASVAAEDAQLGGKA
jgi:hypothetical protein